MKNGTRKRIWFASFLLLLAMLYTELGAPEAIGSVVPSEPVANTMTDHAWQVQVLEVRGSVGTHADLVLDAAGYPHLAYSYDEATISKLKYAYFDGFRWHSEVVDEAVSTGEHVSIALSPDGQPRISYYHRAQTALKYAVRDSNGWQTEVVDANQDRGRFSSMVIDPVNGSVDIIYYESQGERLLHARRSRDQWSYFTVDESASVGEGASLALGPGSLLGTSYYDRTNGDLKYAQWNPSNRSWSAQTVDSSGDGSHHIDCL